MDYGQSEIVRLKSLRFARSYKEAHGHHLDFEEKSNKFTLALFVICIFLLVVVL